MEDWHKPPTTSPAPYLLDPAPHHHWQPTGEMNDGYCCVRSLRVSVDEWRVKRTGGPRGGSGAAAGEGSFFEGVIWRKPVVALTSMKKLSFMSSIYFFLFPSIDWLVLSDITDMISTDIQQYWDVWWNEHMMVSLNPLDENDECSWFWFTFSFDEYCLMNRKVLFGREWVWPFIIF